MAGNYVGALEGRHSTARGNKQTPDLLWNLYRQSSTGTTSVSRMYLASGSSASKCSSILPRLQVSSSKLNENCSFRRNIKFMNNS